MKGKWTNLHTHDQFLVDILSNLRILNALSFKMSVGHTNLPSHHRGIAMKIVPNVHPPMIVLYGGETTASKLCFGVETGHKCTN